jgi:hypothetical protein
MSVRLLLGSRNGQRCRGDKEQGRQGTTEQNGSGWRYWVK